MLSAFDNGYNWIYLFGETFRAGAKFEYILRVFQPETSSVDPERAWRIVATEPLSLNKVFSSSLHPEKTWYALNTVLCSCKPSTFCSSSSAKLFPDEYRLVNLTDLYGDGGVPASFRWFCSYRRSEKVYVASTFGLVLGILRLKSLEDCHFFKSDYFKVLMSSINSFQFNPGDRPRSADEIRLRSQIAAIEAQLSSAAKEILTLRSELRSQQSSVHDSLPTTPPVSPNSQFAPKVQSPPFLKRTIEQINADNDLLPSSKRKKISDKATTVMAQVENLCQRNGETLETVVKACCQLAGSDGDSARDVVISTLDSFVEEKGARTAFSKLVSDESWQKRLQEMRVPDWIYLLFKLKSRISDCGWQDLTNLTNLGRTGVSYH